MASDVPPLSPEEAAQPVNRGMLRDELRSEMAANGGMLRDQLRGEMAANRDILRDEMAAMERELRGEIRASGARIRVLLEENNSKLALVLERLGDAIARKPKAQRVDADIADVRNRADAAGALGPRVNDHERRIRTLEGRQ